MSGAGFAVEALDKLIIPAEFAGQQLQSDPPVQGTVTRQVDCPHPAPAEQFDDFVLGKSRRQRLQRGGLPTRCRMDLRRG
jgi:hypothetical protein